MVDVFSDTQLYRNLVKMKFMLCIFCHKKKGKKHEGRRLDGIWNLPWHLESTLALPSAPSTASSPPQGLMLLPGDTDHRAPWGPSIALSWRGQGVLQVCFIPPLMLCEGCSGADTHGRSLAEERWFCAEVESAKGKAVKGRGVQGPWFCLQDHGLP